MDVREAVYTRPFNLGEQLRRARAAPAARRGRRRAPARPTLPLRYDVQINAPSTLQVRNNTVQMVARANMQLRGTYDRPQLFGRAEVDRGEFLFEGKRYRITRGSMDQANPTKLDPFVDLEMETQVRVPGETYRVTITAQRHLRPRAARLLVRPAAAPSRKSWRCSSATSRRGRTSSSAATAPT